MKHLLIILISILLLSSPVIGQSSKYESVNQCVLQTMEQRGLTGNKMFEMVKEECERSMVSVGSKGKKKGVLYFGEGKGWVKVCKACCFSTTFALMDEVEDKAALSV